MTDRVPFARALIAMGRLALRNLISRRRVVDDGQPEGVVVSLTSYGHRTAFVFLAIESIARGTMRPARLILWLDDLDTVAEPPPRLRRLVARGLEIRPTVDHGPHKKYFPYAVSRFPHSAPLVTADDDWMVPRTWLEQLVEQHRLQPDAVVAHRAHRVMTAGSSLGPYSSWPEASEARATPLHFGTGCFGQLLPPVLLDELRERGTLFEATAARADDVWIHAVAVESGLGVLPLGPRGRLRFLPIRGVGRRGVVPLATENVAGGGNDRQIAATYSDAARAVLTRATALSSSA